MRETGFVALLAVLALTASAVRAQEESGTLEGEIQRLSAKVEEVVVTAERPYVVPLDYAAGRTLIPPQEIRESGQDTIENLLRRNPSVTVHFENASGTKPNLSVRGLNPERSIELAMLVDGIPLAPAPYGHPGQSLFPFTLERVRAVDILRGGYAVRYGPNNVAGVVNFLSNPIPASPAFREKLRFGSDDEFSTFTSLGGTFGDFGILLEGVFRRGEGERQNGDYRVRNTGAKISWRAADRLTILFQLDEFDELTRLPGGLSQAAYDADPGQSQTREDYFEGDQLRGNVRVLLDVDDDQRFEILAYAFRGDRTFYLARPTQYGAVPAQMRSSPRPMEIWAVQPTWNRRGRFLGMDHDFTVGVRFEREEIRNQRYTWNWPDGPKTTNNDEEYDYDAWSAFADDTFRPFEGFELTPGVRFESLDIDAVNRLGGNTVARDFTEVLPGLTAVYWLGSDWTLYGNLQNTFRAPDQARIEMSAKPQDVEAEKAWAYELGTRARPFEGGLYMDATLFWIDFRDRLVQDPTRQDVYLNIGAQRHRGLELLVAADLGKFEEALDGFSVHAGYAFVDTEILQGANRGNDARQAPRNKVNWGAEYHHSTGLWCAFDGSWVDTAFADEANTRAPSADGNLGVMPSYRIWNVRVGYGVDFEDGKGRVELEFGSNNVFDEDAFYRRPGQGIVPAPGRTLYGTFSFGWTW